MPETWAGIKFDKDGLCSLCREAEKEVVIDWAARQKTLKKILSKYKSYAIKKNNKYDCLVGYSGGKDSVYTLYEMVKKYGMRPLVVTFDHGFQLSADAEYNMMAIPKKLDCDHLRFTLGNDFRNALCKKGSQVNGDFCWHCHNGLGAFPARMSAQWDIPLQIWGEPSAKYQTTSDYTMDDVEEQDKERFKKVFRAGITPSMVKPKGYHLRDFLPLTWPKKKFELKALYLGNFQPWDQRKQVDIIKRELSWRTAKVEGTYVNWDKVDCPYEPVRDWQKYIKRGLGRTTFQASKDIRELGMMRKKAIELVKKHDGKRPKALDNFLKEVGMTEKEFMTITKKHIVKPKKK